MFTLKLTPNTNKIIKYIQSYYTNYKRNYFKNNKTNKKNGEIFLSKSQRFSCNNQHPRGLLMEILLATLIFVTKDIIKQI